MEKNNNLISVLTIPCYYQLISVYLNMKDILMLTLTSKRFGTLDDRIGNIKLLLAVKSDAEGWSTCIKMLNLKSNDIFSFMNSFPRFMVVHKETSYQLLYAAVIFRYKNEWKSVRQECCYDGLSICHTNFIKYRVIYEFNKQYAHLFANNEIGEFYTMYMYEWKRLGCSGKPIHVITEIDSRIREHIKIQVRKELVEKYVLMSPCINTSSKRGKKIFDKVKLFIDCDGLEYINDHSMINKALNYCQ